MTRLDRRQFGKAALAVAATITIAGTKSSGKVLGANDTVRVAIAGLNGRGSAHVGGYVSQKGVEIAYLVDPDKRTFSKRVKDVEGKTGKAPKTIQDIFDLECFQKCLLPRQPDI